MGRSPAPAVLVHTRVRLPRWRGTVLDTRWLLAAARLLALVVIVYLLASIVVRATRGQWVRSAGSVSTDAAAARAITDDQWELQRRR